MSTLTIARLQAASVAALLTGLAALTVWQRPGETVSWMAVAIGVLAMGLLGWVATVRHERRIELLRALTGASLILAAALLMGLLRSAGWIDEAAGDRILGAIMGLVLVVMGNQLPKQLKPLAETRCDPAAAQRLHRFAGWAFVLAGLGFAAAWLFLPLPSARWVAMGVLATTLLLVLLRVGWSRRHLKRAESDR